jgi:hypothetical protein
MAVGEGVLLVGAWIGLAIVVPKLKSWVAARLVVYVKRRYPDEWHLPVNRTLLGGISVLAFIAIVGFAGVIIASMLTV